MNCIPFNYSTNTYLPLLSYPMFPVSQKINKEKTTSQLQVTIQQWLRWRTLICILWSSPAGQAGLVDSGEYVNQWFGVFSNPSESPSFFGHLYRVVISYNSISGTVGTHLGTMFGFSSKSHVFCF